MSQRSPLPPDHDGLFRFRLDAAELGLSNLRRVLRSIQGRAQHVSELQKQLSVDVSKISSVSLQLGVHVDHLQRLAKPHEEGDKHLFGQVDIVHELTQTLSNLSTAARKRVAELAGQPLDPTLLIDSQKEFLDKKVKNNAERVEDLRDEGATGGDKSWTELREIGGAWIEYLDYVMGLCLRYDGLDMAICEIGDALITELKTSIEALGAVAVPGREYDARFEPNLVYLSFPECTLWALPLVAHELWHVATHKSNFGRQFNRTARKYLNNKAVHEERPARRDLEDYLADTFATYVMGPSYACAALLLALDPFSPHDQKRAAVILKVLEADSYAYGDIHRQLSGLWKRTTSLGPQDIRVDASAEAWVLALLEYLQKTKWNSKPEFPKDDWLGISESWVTTLLDDARKGPSLDNMNLRLALAVAWSARLMRPDSSETVAERAREICFSIIHSGRKKEPATASRGFGPDAL